MFDLNWKKFGKTLFCGSAVLFAILSVFEVKAYLGAVAWAIFLSNAYFFHRLESIVMQAAAIHMMDSNMVKGRLDVVMNQLNDRDAA